MKLAICLSGGISEAVPFVCRITAVPAAGHLETDVPDKEVFMTVLSVDKEMGMVVAVDVRRKVKCSGNARF